MQTVRAPASAPGSIAYRPGTRLMIEIDAPTVSVWEELNDADNHHRWLGSASTIVESVWPRAPRNTRQLGAPRQPTRVVRWHPTPRVILHAIRPDGVVTRLEFELHALRARTLVVVDEIALHPGSSTRPRAASWRTRHWSRRSLVALRRRVEQHVHGATNAA